VLFRETREMIETASREQMAHRDALVGRTLSALREVMNATEARTVVIGPDEAPGEGREGKDAELEGDDRDTSPNGDGGEEDAAGTRGPRDPKARRRH
jgi:hypothetical protein